jgi:hypothetical protein
MARARSIKPGFFNNEDLIELAFEIRLLFAGLWTLADREGRLEDRPKKIKLSVFPGDDVDVEHGLTQLEHRKFICRYSANGIRYIQIVSWSKHQSPHVKEAPSTIPAPCEHRANTSVAALTPSSLTPDSGLLVSENTFEPIKAAYPKFSGRQDWLTAEHHWNRRIEDGSKPESLLSAVRRYAEYCDSGGVSGPQFVMAPGKFFSAADKPWEQSWDPPPTKAQVSQNANVAASVAWLERNNGTG